MNEIRATKYKGLPMEREFDNQLTFDDYIARYSEELTMLFAESGADRELDFDFERDAEKQYYVYLSNTAYPIGTSNWNIHRLR
jgi:hypothetical protein